MTLKITVVLLSFDFHAINYPNWSKLKWYWESKCLHTPETLCQILFRSVLLDYAWIIRLLLVLLVTKSPVFGSCPTGSSHKHTQNWYLFPCDCHCANDVFTRRLPVFGLFLFLWTYSYTSLVPVGPSLPHWSSWCLTSFVVLLRVQQEEGQALCCPGSPQHPPGCAERSAELRKWRVRMMTCMCS